MFQSFFLWKLVMKIEQWIQDHPLCLVSILLPLETGHEVFPPAKPVCLELTFQSFFLWKLVMKFVTLSKSRLQSVFQSFFLWKLVMKPR